MNALVTRIAYLKTQPHQVKKQVVYGVASLATALIAVMWLTASLATNSFALETSSTPAPVATAPTDQSTLQMAGVAGALIETDAPAHIEIVDTTPKTPQAPEATIIPF